jgi:glycerophosphoryl diester phosphodiesterase
LIRAALALVLALLPGMTLGCGPPMIVAHRGASGYLPEHTLAAYALAIEQGADFIEPDLVITRDGHLVARHERHLGATTDVADRPEFAARRAVKPGRRQADWYVEDFTLAELRTLRARQPFPGRSRDHDGLHPIPTFEEVLALIRDRSAALGRPIGVYPEAKHPEAFRRLGLEFADPLLAALEAHGFGPGGLPVYIQSFEARLLRELRGRTRIPLVMLLEDEGGRPNVALEEAARFADAVGPAKSLLRDRRTGRDSGFVARAHALGLAVHPWTFRDDRVAPGFTGPAEELRATFALGVDAVFVDFPDTAVAVRNQFVTVP